MVDESNLSIYTKTFYYNDIKDTFSIIYSGDASTETIKLTTNVTVIWNWGELENANIIMRYYSFDNNDIDNSSNGEIVFMVSSFHFSIDYPNIIIDSYTVDNKRKESDRTEKLEYKTLLLELNSLLSFADEFVQKATNYKTHIQ